MSRRHAIAIVVGSCFVGFFVASSGTAWSSCESADGEFRLELRRSNVDETSLPAFVRSKGDLVVYLDEQSSEQSPRLSLEIEFSTDEQLVIFATRTGPSRVAR